MSPCARQPFGPWLARHPPVVGGQGHKDCIDRATFDGAGRRVIPEKGFGVNSAFRVNGHRKANRIEPRCAATSPAPVDEEDLSAGVRRMLSDRMSAWSRACPLHHLEEIGPLCHTCELLPEPRIESERWSIGHTLPGSQYPVIELGEARSLWPRRWLEASAQVGQCARHEIELCRPPRNRWVPAIDLVVDERHPFAVVVSIEQAGNRQAFREARHGGCLTAIKLDALSVEVDSEGLHEGLSAVRQPQTDGGSRRKSAMLRNRFLDSRSQGAFNRATDVARYLVPGNAPAARGSDSHGRHSRIASEIAHAARLIIRRLS